MMCITNGEVMMDDTQGVIPNSNDTQTKRKHKSKIQVSHLTLFFVVLLASSLDVKPKAAFLAFKDQFPDNIRMLGKQIKTNISQMKRQATHSTQESMSNLIF